ncbi:hypothetical protein [Lentzea sp. NPDC003310]|uniref:hypothetical protein n=1 Tax=Lentzea sp. NPDC003310 TaxID=3154447 RepID=UPI0033B25ABC
MPVALGAPTHRDEAAEVYEEVVKRVPDLVNATWRRLQTKTAKWHGSHEEMFAFARAGVQGLPDGHPLLALVPIAHLEMHLDKMAKSGKWARKWEIATLSYWKKQRAEVDAVSDRLLAGAADQPYSLWAHQIFAMFYFQAEAKDRLALHLAQSGQRAARWPWAYLGDPNKRFAAAQQMARS